MNKQRNNYVVLARKYRPKRLEHLIGQSEILSVLKGAITFNRLAHAYLLSGTRGIGKTTLARIIAKIVNCLDEKALSEAEPCNNCKNCISIDSENNIDVIEIDAASRTGVNDIREIIENINYKPVSALKKIYIIDEVHMLSKAAFNALLKTLEEPPKSVLFLLATTETEKIPVTILSRCQRLELRRIENLELSSYIKKIASLENFEIDNASSDLIAKCAEGSVRDALSILDGSFSKDESIKIENTRKLLGIPNFNNIFKLFDEICNGKIKNALNDFNLLFHTGASVEQLIKELMRIVYYLARIKSNANNDCLNLDSEQYSLLSEYSKKIDMDVIIRFWELLQKYLSEISKSFDQFQCFEMILMRLCYISLLPTPFEGLNRNIDEKKIHNNEKSSITDAGILRENTDSSLSNTNNILSNSRKMNNEFQDYIDIVKFLEEKSEHVIVHHLENNFKLVSIKTPKNNSEMGILELKQVSSDKNIKELLWNISKILEKFTGSRWMVSISNKDLHKTLKDFNQEKKNILINKLSTEETIKKLLEIIPDSEIVSIERLINKNK